MKLKVTLISILALLGLMLLVSSCNCDTSNLSKPQQVGSEVLKTSDSWMTEGFSLRKFNGHTYVIFMDGGMHCSGGGGAAMVHDPDCACNMK